MADLGPKVEIKELDTGTGVVIQGAEVTFGVLGNSERGPEDTPITVTKNNIARVLGNLNHLSEGVRLLQDYFSNGGSVAQFVRKARTDAVLATGDLNSGQATIKGAGRGAYYNRVKLRIIGNQFSFNFTTFEFERFDLEVLEEVEIGLGEFNIVESYTSLTLWDKEDSRFYIDVINDQSEYITIDAGLLDGEGLPAEFEGVATLATALGVGDAVETNFFATLGNVPLQPESILIKVDNVLVASDDGEGNIEGVDIAGTVNYLTGIISVDFVTAPALGEVLTIDSYKKAVGVLDVALTLGADGVVISTRNDLTATSLQSTEKGLYAFNKHIGILQMTVADFSTNEEVSKDLIACCETRPTNDRFALMMVPRGYNASKAVKYKIRTLASNSSFGAIYWPHVKASNELRDGRVEVHNPIGMIVGTYARRADATNINQAPAGIEAVLFGATGLEQRVEQEDMDIVYPSFVNSIRIRPEGVILWGNRTLQKTGDFQQINTRLFFMKVENDLFDPSHEYVFKSIGDRLFSRAKLKIEGYFRNLFDTGYFEASTFADAVTVIIDESNNTTATINAKKFIIDVRIKENTSGEFVTLRFAKKVNDI